MGCMVCTWGWGWGGVGWSGGNNVHVNLKACHATLCFLLLYLHTYVMLRCGIFSCTCTRASCYAVLSSLAHAHRRDATLWDLLLHLRTYVIMGSDTFLPKLRPSSNAVILTLLAVRLSNILFGVFLPRFLFGVPFLSVLPSRIVPGTWLVPGLF